MSVLDQNCLVDVFVDANLDPECEGTDGELTVADNMITGYVFADIDADGRLDVTGEILADGSISGGFALTGGAAYATYTGNVISTGFEGDWVDDFGCTGTWEANKR